MIKAQSIRKGGFLSLSLGLFGKLLGFFTTLSVAYLFGATEGTDLVYFLYNQVLFGSYLFSTLSANLVLPTWVRMKSENESQANHLLASFLGKSLLILFVLVSILCIFLPQALPSVSGISKETLESSTIILLSLIPLLLLNFYNDFLIQFIQFHRNFSFTYLSSLATGALCLLMIWSFHQSLGVAAFALGFLASGITQAVILMIYLKKIGVLIKPSFGPLPKESEFLKKLPPILLLQAGILSGVLGTDLIASFLDKGAITIFSNARKIFELVPGIIIFPLVLVLFPRICNPQLQKSNQFPQFILDFQALLFAIAAAASLFLFFCGKEISLLLFLRGEYTPDQATKTGLLIQILVLSLPGICFQSLAGRLVIALQTKKSLWWYSALTLLANLLFVFILYAGMKYQGLLGIGLAFLFYNLVLSSLIHGISLEISGAGISYLELWKSLTFSLLATIPAGLGLFFARQTSLNGLAWIGFCLLLVCVFYSLPHWLFKSRAFQTLRGILKNQWLEVEWG